MLYVNNTPDSDCQVSPAKITYGRQLQDSFYLFLNRQKKFSNPAVLSTCRKARKLNKETLNTQFSRNSENLDQGVTTTLIMLVSDAWYKIRPVVNLGNGIEVDGDST